MSIYQTVFSERYGVSAPLLSRISIARKNSTFYAQAANVFFTNLCYGMIL